MHSRSILAVIMFSWLPVASFAYPSCPSTISDTTGACGANGDLTITSSGAIIGNATGTSGGTTRDFALSNPVASSITIYGTVRNDSTGAADASGLWNYPSTTLTNLTVHSGGSITGANAGIGIFNDSGSTISTLINSGGIYGGTNSYAIIDYGTIETLRNTSTGIISSDSSAVNLTNTSRLINEGSITSTNSYGIRIAPGTVGSIENSGSIRSSGPAIYVDGSVTSLTNTGTIASTNGDGITIDFSNFGTITNYGTISGLGGDILSIASTFGTLNNAQSGLRIASGLPSTYQIILGRNAHTYGTLNYIDGSGILDHFGIYDGTVKDKSYVGVLRGISTVTNGTTGSYGGYNYQLVLESGSSDVWDLLFPTYLMATNTLTAVQQNAVGLSTIYNQQAAAYQAALSYDCQVYDQNNLCASVGGRYTYAGPSPSSNQQAGLLILGYKPYQNFRVGAFADQSVNISTPNGFTQSKTSPMWGFFAKWHKNRDETGLGVQASAVTSASTLTATRVQLTDTEAGSGSTQFNGQGYQLTTNYHLPVTSSSSLVPYLGLRYTRISAGAYTENTTSTVASPLSYNAMVQNTFSAIGGVGVRSHLAEKLTGTASVGIQQNLNYTMGNYAGTSSINGLESFSVQMPGNVNAMATATVGMFYDVNKRERFGLNVLWQQQPFIATNTTTALATYTIGF